MMRGLVIILAVKRGGGGESCKDSASGEQCGSVANFVKGTTDKVANLPQSLQSSHSPTANPRILEEESQVSHSSLRAAQSGVAIHNPNTQNLESSIDSSALAGSTSDKLTLSQDRLRALDSLLKEHGLEICASDLLIFLQQAIEGRESVKFAFSKLLSKALSYIKELGESLQIPASDMAHLDIKSILSLYASLYKESPKERFLQEIAANKQEYDLTCALKLPPLITKPEEVFAFFSSKVIPNFITQKLAIGKAIELDSTTQQDLQGSIVLIKSADPGYDYLFTKNIAGFITCYGGSNSHMAIRASELQIPAVIGVGEHAYQAYANASKIQIDCQAQRIVCL